MRPSSCGRDLWSESTPTTGNPAAMRKAFNAHELHSRGLRHLADGEDHFGADQAVRSGGNVFVSRAAPVLPDGVDPNPANSSGISHVGAVVLLAPRHPHNVVGGTDVRDRHVRHEPHRVQVGDEVVDGCAVDDEPGGLAVVDDVQVVFDVAVRIEDEGLRRGFWPDAVRRQGSPASGCDRTRSLTPRCGCPTPPSPPADRDFCSRKGSPKWVMLCATPQSPRMFHVVAAGPAGLLPVEPICAPTGRDRITGRSRPRRSFTTCGPVLSPLRRRWSYVRPLDKRTAVGVARSVVLQRVYRSPTCVPISNVCTDLQRVCDLQRVYPTSHGLWADAREHSGPARCAEHPSGRRRWSYVRPLDKRTVGVRARGSPTWSPTRT